MTPAARAGVRLRDLLRDAFGERADLGDAAHAADPLVFGIAQQADRVRPGWLFVARVGARHDAHDFVPEALARGAVAIVGTRPGLVGLPVPYVVVGDDRRATSALAAAFHGHPGRALAVAGVTGTDGKTTTAAILHHLLQGDGAAARATLLSTAAVRFGRAEEAPEAGFTTPEATEVQAHLARARELGARFAVLEASSHASALQRLADVPFAVMAWTNLTPEHLDLHGTFDAYRAAKTALVAQAAAAVLNRDDPHFPAFAAAARGTVTTYALGTDADLRAHDVVATPDGGQRFTVARGAAAWSAELPMAGRYNVANALAALATAETLGVPVADGVVRLRSFAGVRGRMQRVQESPFAVMVDFAHTPPALEAALAAVTPAPGGRRLVLIGAPGERDGRKRPELGAVAVTRADVAVFAEDDTRSEDLGAILDAMAGGARAAGGVEGVTFHVVPDRRLAIRRVLALARPGDVVLLAGKGHERTLQRPDGTIPWDEAAEAREALRGSGA